MKRFTPLVGAMALGYRAGSVAAFSSRSGAIPSVLSSRLEASHPSFSLPSRLFSSQSPCETTGNDLVDLTQTKGSARLLRQLVLKDANGNQQKLDTVMGPDTSIVVFLRHLAWVYCWTYAREWASVQQQQLNNIPLVFVSIGTSDKLGLFLEKNPMVPRDQIWVDDDLQDMQAYSTVGLTRKFTEAKFDSLWEPLSMLRIPSLNPIEMAKYLVNIPDLAPVEGRLTSLDNGLPEGGIRLGGTFVVHQDEVVYQWNDRLPGDTPNVQDIIRVANQYSQQKS